MELMNILLEVHDSEVKRRVIKGFKLVPAPEGFDDPYITLNGYPNARLATSINNWIQKIFPFSNISVRFEKNYRTINFIEPVEPSILNR